MFFIVTGESAIYAPSISLALLASMASAPDMPTILVPSFKSKAAVTLDIAISSAVISSHRYPLTCTVLASAAKTGVLTATDINNPTAANTAVPAVNNLLITFTPLNQYFSIIAL